MTLRFTLDPDLTPDLRAAVTALWVDATNAGGAVGFVPPVGPAQVEPVAERAFEGTGPGQPDRLLVAYEEESGRPAGLLFFTSMRFDLMEHWRLLTRVMVHPALQGAGTARPCWPRPSGSPATGAWPG